MHKAFRHSLGNGFFRASLMEEATLNQAPKAKGRAKGQRWEWSQGKEAWAGEADTWSFTYIPKAKSHPGLTALHPECPGSLELPCDENITLFQRSRPSLALVCTGRGRVEG